MIKIIKNSNILKNIFYCFFLLNKDWGGNLNPGVLLGWPWYLHKIEYMGKLIFQYSRILIFLNMILIFSHTHLVGIYLF